MKLCGLRSILAVFGFALAVFFASCTDRKTSAVVTRTQDAAAADKPGLVAFVDVNVLPMDRERILERQTVIVRDGRIAAMGAVASIKVPKEALRIDGGGRYLMPGLVDMHAHLYTPEEFPLYLAHGVTTVYNLWGRPRTCFGGSVSRAEKCWVRPFTPAARSSFARTPPMKPGGSPRSRARPAGRRYRWC